MSMHAEQIFPFEEFELSDADFNWFAQKLRSSAGISLNDSKRNLLIGRLRPRIKALGLSTFAEYRSYLQKTPVQHPEWEKFINALTTNKTDWFREPAHFYYLLRKFIPRWRLSGRKHLNVWSVACSSGEEPYTLSILLKHHLFKDESFEILATDIDSTVLSRAKNGVYLRSRIEEQIPKEYRATSFSAGSGDIADWVRVRNVIRENVVFEQMNLLEIPDIYPRDFDVAFCRNVLIYFEQKNIESVVNQIWQHCAIGAMFAVGHSESLQSVKSPWQSAQPSVYLKSDNTTSRASITPFDK